MQLTATAPNPTSRAAGNSPRRDGGQPMTDEAAPTTEPAEKKDGDTLVFKGHLFRKRRGQGYVFTEKPPEPKPVHEPVRRPARVAQMLAFAHGLGAAIERGEFRDQADAARHFQLTRARITQLMNLTLLAPDIQEQVLFLEAVDGREPMSERDLRTVIYAGDWGAQREEWANTFRPRPASAGARCRSRTLS